MDFISVDDSVEEVKYGRIFKNKKLWQIISKNHASMGANDVIVFGMKKMNFGI